MVVTHRDYTSVPLLTTHIQLCLAHHCDVHGPTPLMVTEGLPVACSRCYDDSTDPERPTSATTITPPSVADALRKMTLNSSRSSSMPASELEAQNHRAAMRRVSRLATASGKGPAVTAASPTTASAIETPPQSPRKAPESLYTEGNNNNHNGGPRRDSSFRRTYDDYVTKRANPCQNCALTLPRRQHSPSGADNNVNGSPSSDSDLREPKLRTRTPYAFVYGGSSRDHSPPNSNPESSCVSDAEGDDGSANDLARTQSQRRPTTSTSRSSVSSRSSVHTHKHFLDYTSTHEPQAANTYSTVRASCLRTLTFETLPRRPEHGSNSSSTMSSPTSSVAPSFPPSYMSPPGALSSNYTGAPLAPQSAAAGGPIFFGDPLAGYTTAYIFRIPDMHARGRKRVYAFLALSTHRERLAMKAFGFLAAAFRDLATWIQDLVEAEAEREREREEEGTSTTSGYNAAYGGGGGYSRGPRDSGVGLGLGGGSSFDRDRDSGSSFLTGGGRSGFTQRMGGSMGPGGFAPKARGLAELSGLPDFFIQLHARFVQLLVDLGMVLA